VEIATGQIVELEGVTVDGATYEWREIELMDGGE
jgi:hypothetical protein